MDIFLKRGVNVHVTIVGCFNPVWEHFTSKQIGDGEIFSSSSVLVTLISVTRPSQGCPWCNTSGNAWMNEHEVFHVCFTHRGSKITRSQIVFGTTCIIFEWNIHCPASNPHRVTFSSIISKIFVHEALGVKQYELETWICFENKDSTLSPAQIGMVLFQFVPFSFKDGHVIFPQSKTQGINFTGIDLLNFVVY
jgi:hypothetical protein